MISPQFLVEKLKENNIDFYAGVPDSLLKNLCAYITDNLDPKNNIIAANEGGAIGLAAGHYLATGKIPVAYMQNSGLGNTVNPIMSLTDKDVYNIPVLLIVGWRGEPGVKDEPQHIKQGKVTLPQLETIGVKYEILSHETNEVEKQLKVAIDYMQSTKESYALVIRKNTFEEYKLQNVVENGLSLKRETAIEMVTSALSNDDIVVSTTGMISRELFEYRERVNQSHENDFLTVGSMGHASQIALGIALEKGNRKVYCYDGDGATIMHMGSLAIVGAMSPKNYIHIVFNNGAHDSVGGQPTVGLNLDIKQIALSCGYKSALSVDDEKNLKDAIAQLNTLESPVLLEVKVKKGARKDLGRPTKTPIQNKEDLMANLSK